jgi:hypothetical protein
MEEIAMDKSLLIEIIDVAIDNPSDLKEALLDLDFAFKTMNIMQLLIRRGEVWQYYFKRSVIPSVACEVIDLIDGAIALREIGGKEGWR